MIECARCGYRNDAAAKFCAACGAPMLAVQATQQPKTAPPGPEMSMQGMHGQGAGAAPAPAYAAAWGPAAAPVAPDWAGSGHPAAPQPAPPQGMPPYGSPPWGAAPPVAVPPAWGRPGSSAESTDPNTPANAPTAPSAVMPPLEADQIPANAARVLSAFLVAFDANPLGEFWPIHQGQASVGRKGSSPELTIGIDHPTTSSRHAKLYAAARPGRLKVEDLGSTNGTYVNERRLEPNERRTLEHGDTLRFGGFSVTVVLV